MESKSVWITTETSNLAKTFSSSLEPFSDGDVRKMLNVDSTGTLLCKNCVMEPYKVVHGVIYCYDCSVSSFDLPVNIETLRLSAANCVICDELASWIFIGCGHYCVCGPCASKIDKCPVCRKVSSLIQVFIS